MHTIQKIIRHKDPRITSETYLHLDPSYLRKQIDRLTFSAPETIEDEPSVSTPATAAGPLVSIVCLAGGEGGLPDDHDSLEILAAGAVAMERDSGFEPPTFSLGRATPEGAAGRTPPQVLTSPHKLSGGLVQGSQGPRQNPKGFVTRLLPGERRGLRAHRGGYDGRLLTVAEVAEELAVSPATVYKLVTRGALECVRVLNAIRVRRVELQRFVREGTGS